MVLEVVPHKLYLLQFWTCSLISDINPRTVPYPRPLTRNIPAGRHAMQPTWAAPSRPSSCMNSFSLGASLIFWESYHESSPLLSEKQFQPKIYLVQSHPICLNNHEWIIWTLLSKGCCFFLSFFLVSKSAFFPLFFFFFFLRRLWIIGHDVLLVTR